MKTGYYKAIWCFGILFCACTIVQAQNLVPNPSFESYNACPAGISEIKFINNPAVNNWHSVGTADQYNTPDYFHRCGVPAVAVPSNSFGWQEPRTGDAYAGIFIVSNAGASMDYGEYLQIQLSQPMQAGRQYAVSCYVSRANTSAQNQTGKIVVTDQLGIVFSQFRPMTMSINRITMPVSVSNPTGNYIRDTNWVRMSWIYTATGGEEWMTIGNFEQTLHYITHRLPPPNINTLIFLSYLYFDDFCVTDIGTNTSSRDTILCNNESLTLTGPAGMTGYEWSTGDTTTQITITTPGTYWVRAHNECHYETDTIHISGHHSSFPDLGNDTTYCSGVEVVLSPGVSLPNYQWSTGATTSSIRVTTSGNYILTTTDICGTYSDSINIEFIPDPPEPGINDTTICQYAEGPVILNNTGDSLRWYPGPGSSWEEKQPDISTQSGGTHILYVSRTSRECESAVKEIKIDILEAPKITLPADTILCEGSYLLLENSTTPDVQFMWNTGDTLCCIFINQEGLYTVDASGLCGKATDSIQIEIARCDQCIFIPSAFTPNNDGRNDVFRAQTSCRLTQFHLTVVNRWGQTVFQTTNFRQGWDGNFNSLPAETGTYYYLVKAVADIPAANKEILMKGDVMLIR